jgi:hypothetical protein
LPHGTKGAGSHFMQRVRMSLKEAIKKGIVVIYMDDIIIKGRNWQEFVQNWLYVIELLMADGWKIGALKTVLYDPEVKFCGRVFSERGIEFDPDFVQSVINMPVPENADELRRYVACLNYPRKAIPHLAELVAPLMNLLTVALATVKGQVTKAAASKVKLADIGWKPLHNEAFKKCNEALANMITLAYPRDGWKTCVFTDALDLFWAGLVTQYPPEDEEKPL